MQTTTITCATCGDDLFVEGGGYVHTDAGIGASCYDARGDLPILPVIAIVDLPDEDDDTGNLGDVRIVRGDQPYTYDLVVGMGLNMWDDVGTVNLLARTLTTVQGVDYPVPAYIADATTFDTWARSTALRIVNTGGTTR